MQGRLRGEPLSVAVDSSCAFCGETLRLKIDHEAVCTVRKGGPDPFLFHPLVDLERLPEPNIINAF